MKLRYFEIGWMSRVDGPDNRVVVFLQGCNLRCPWCHSPHSWKQSAPLLFNSNICRKCYNCVNICKHGVHKIENGIHTIDRKKCIKCGRCIEVCQNSKIGYLGSALSLPTREIEVSVLFEMLRPQLEIVKNSGGITISGGEALLQADAVKELLCLCKEQGISTCVETSMTLQEKKYELVAPYVDYWLVGFRRILLTDNKEERQACDIHTSTDKILQIMNAYAKKIIARYPIILGYSISEQKLEQFLNQIKKNNINYIELLPCNQNLMHYYDLSGEIPQFTDKNLVPSQKLVEEIEDYFRKNGISVKKELA